MSRHRPLRLVPLATRCWWLVLAIAFAVDPADPHLASAGSNTWFSGATGGSWQTASHWGNGLLNTIVPGATSGTTNTDTATFDSASNTTSVIPDANRNLKFITFDTAAAAYTIGTTGGNSLVMTSGGMIEIASTFSATNQTETIDAPLVLEGNYTLADNSTNAGVLLDFGGAITSGAAGGIALTVAGAGNTTIGGAINNGSRTTALVKSGAGTLALSGNNTFTGGVTIDAGILEIANAGALNSAAPDAVAFGPGSTGSLVLKVGAITLGGLSTNATVGTPVVQTFSGVQSSLTINNASDNTFGGVLKDGTGVTAALSLIKSGAGTLTLSGSNTFTGGVTINAGNLQLGNAGALNGNSIAFGSGSTGTLSLAGNNVTIGGLNTNATVGSPTVQNASAVPASLTIASAANITYPGVLQDGPGGGALALVVKMGLGTLVLSGSNTFTGGVTINSGTLQLGSAGALNANGANGLTFPAGSTGTLILAGNSATLSALSGSNSEEKMIYPAVQNANATPATLTVNNSSASLFNGELQDGAGGGALSLVKSGAGTLTLGPAYGSNTFTGSVTVNAGVLYVGPNSLNSATPNVVTFGPASTGMLGLLDDVTVSGLSTNANVGSPAVAGGGLSTALWTLTVNNASEDVFAGRLLDGQSHLALFKTGAGTLTLSANNSFTGGLTINAGTVQLGSAGALNSTSNPLKFSANSTGTLTLNGNSAAVGDLDTNLPLGAPVLQNASDLPATLAVNIAASSSTYAGILRDGLGSGSLFLTKSGPGVLLLTGTDMYTGGTSVIGGTLQTTGIGTLGGGASALTISAANGITSAVNLGNSQNVSSLSATFTGTGVVSLSIGSGVTLTDNQSSVNTAFQGVLINSGTFAKSGTSSLEINSAPTLNTNSALQVNGGTLRFNFVSGTATIGTGVTATIASGATLQLAGSVSALASGSYRVNITNNSNSTGLLVSGTNQQVGSIDGSGTTQINTGSDLTANHIIQAVLVIGGATGSPATVTIAASDASGNSLDLADSGPLGPPSGFDLVSSSAPGSSFKASGFSSANLSSGTGVDPTALSPGNSAMGVSISAVPEPSTLALALLAVLGVVSTEFARYQFRRQAV